MARGKKHTAEQVVNLLRQVEVGVANGKSMDQACKEAEIVEQTYYRWRKEYGGLRVDQARRLKELEQENSKLKRLVSELSLEKHSTLPCPPADPWRGTSALGMSCP
jgi:transposase-like protein